MVLLDAELDELESIILPDALLKLILAEGTSRSELHLVGNNAGIVSLANVLRWLSAAPTRRACLSLPDLPFVWSEAAASLTLRRTDEAHEARYGLLRRLEVGSSFEWLLSESELPKLADSLNLLADLGGRERMTYDTPSGGQDSWDAVVHVQVDETVDGA